MARPAAAWAAVLAACAQTPAATATPRRLSPSEWLQRRELTPHPTWTPTPPLATTQGGPRPQGGGGGLYKLATDFGADPTGKADASDAIEKALTTIWAHPPAQASSGQWMMPVRPDADQPTPDPPLLLLTARPTAGRHRKAPPSSAPTLAARRSTWRAAPTPSRGRCASRPSAAAT